MSGVSPSRTDPARAFEELHDGLAELATLVLSQVERAVTAWDEADPSVAESVIATDREVDTRSAALEGRILELHRTWPAFAGDLRLLHVGLIAAVALERVGNLAVDIAKLAGSVPLPSEGLETVRDLIGAMSRCAVDALSRAVVAISREDVEAGEGAVRDARRVNPMLDRVLHAVSQAPSESGMRAWTAAAVLVARHIERIANNAAEIGQRVRFLVSGETLPSDAD